jgi:predicted ester cyclase
MAQAKDTAARFIAAFNAHDESALRELNATDAKFEAPGGVNLTGRDASSGYAIAWLKAFPDANMIVRNEVVSDPWVVQECRFEGTHTAPLQGPNGMIAATGRRLVSNCVQVGRYENGQAVHVRLYYDQIDVLAQLGQMPVPATS